MTIRELSIKQKVLQDRYLQPGETERDMYSRVADAIASNTDRAIRYFNIMYEGFFLPNTPTLVNAGREEKKNLSACFVVPIGDSLESIYEALESQGKIHSSFGGTGFDFSEIRPKGTLIKSTGGKATGPIGFMKLFNENATAVRQGGIRDGGNMGILRVDHPDIMKFIECKSEEGVLSHFNISVAITDEFIQAVHDNTSYALKWGGREWADLDANEVLNTLCNSAHKTGEPGIVFIDEINRTDNLSHLTKICSTNPCGEQPLRPYESCNLGSINLSKMLHRDSVHDELQIDWDKLEHVTKIAVQFLNDVIDKNEFPMKEIEDATLLTRNIGLGVMGWHDMLIKLGIPYNSVIATNMAKSVMAHITDVAVIESERLSEFEGPYPAYICSGSDNDKPRRNATLTTIAPTGTLSILAKCSSGVEPIFAWNYERNIESGSFDIENDMYSIAKAHNNEDLMKVAQDFTYKAHIDMQSAFQEHVHNAVSKTINMSSDSTVDDIRDAIIRAYHYKCKGITIYRNKSRDDQVLVIKKNDLVDEYVDGDNIDQDAIDKFKCDFYGTPSSVNNKRPDDVFGKTSHRESGCGKLFVTVNSLFGKPVELFVHHSDGGCQSNMEAIGRLISLGLKHNITVHEITEQLDKIKCVNAIRSDNSSGRSCPHIIGTVLNVNKVLDNFKDQEQSTPIGLSKLHDSDIIEDLNQLPKHQKFTRDTLVGGNVCPDCYKPLNFGEGCMKGSCPKCGWTGCN